MVVQLSKLNFMRCVEPVHFENHTAHITNAVRLTFDLGAR